MTVPEPDELLVETDGHIRKFTINRPRRRNALSRSLLGKLSEALLEAGEDPDVWVIVITGAGQQAFCAGADLKEMTENDQAGRKLRSPWARPERSIFEIVSETYKPTIAAINGSAVAGGFELALACDLRIASSEAQFGMPEAKRGMGANFASVLLPRLIPTAVAYQMLFTGDYISAAEAERWGLLNAVVPPDEVGPTADALAKKIAANAPITIRRIKEMAAKGREMPLLAALHLDVGPNPYLSEDREEGVRAFVEGRAPQWRNR